MGKAVIQAEHHNSSLAKDSWVEVVEEQTGQHEKIRSSYNSPLFNLFE